MKISSWNVRSAGRKCFFSQVKDLIVKYNPYIHVFTRTRIKENRGDNISNKISWSNFLEISPVDFFGGI